MIDIKERYKVLVPKNCGVKLRSQQESLHVIREQLEQLKLRGEGRSHLAKIYSAILMRQELKPSN